MMHLPKDYCDTDSEIPVKIPSTKEIVLQAVAQQLGPKAVETVDLSTVSGTIPNTTEPLPEIPICATQDSGPQNLGNDPTALMVGWQSKIPRWRPYSVIKYTAWKMGYDSQEDADYAAYHLWLAAEAWNNADVGIRFEYVPYAKYANFVICHQGKREGTLARGYFPNDNDLNFLYVYSLAFEPQWKPHLWKVLTHELGHILGLRHEFAMQEQGNAVQYGEKNPLSVMAYQDNAPPEIQPSDIATTKAFYELPAGYKISWTPIVDYHPK